MKDSSDSGRDGSSSNLTTAPTDKQRLAHLWEEYTYRHELCWRLTFRLTVAITTLSVIPYVKRDWAPGLEGYTRWLPVIATLLAAFSVLVMWNELSLFRRIWTKFHPTQDDFLGLKGVDRFKVRGLGANLYTVFVLSYFLSLFLLSAWNTYLVFVCRTI